MSAPVSHLRAGAISGVDDYPVDLAWLPDGLLAIGGGEGALALMHAESGEVRTLGRHDPGVLGVAALPGEGSLVTSGQDGSVRLWKPEALTDAGTVEPQVVHRGMGWPQGLAADVDGRRFAFASGKQVCVHGTDGARQHAFGPLPAAPSLLAWRGRIGDLAVAGQTSAWLCETKGGRVTELALEGGPVCLAYSPDGRVLAAGLQDGVVSFRYVATGKKSRMSGYDGKVMHVAWSANSRYLATAASGASTTVIWDFGGKGPEGSTPQQLGTHTDRIEALAFQPRGKLLATAGRDGRLALWQPGPQYRVSPHGNAPLPQAMDVHLLPATPVALRWSPDGKRLAVALEDGGLRLFEVASG